MEERLGLAGQPRVVLFHVKNGRHHCHVVWSRIDIKRMKAIHLGHDRQKLRKCAQELAAEFGLALPKGLAEDRGPARFEDPARAPAPSRADKERAKASGITPEARRAAVTEAWRMSDDGLSLQAGLEERGYLLAKGDRRSYVVVDLACDVHSLPRQIEGVNTREVAAKLQNLPLAKLPTADRAKILMAQRAAALRDAARERLKKDLAAAEARNRLLRAQRLRKLAVDQQWQKVKLRQMHERKVMLAWMLAEKKRQLARRHWQAIGLALYLRKVAALRELIRYYEKQRRKQLRTLEEFHREVKAAMKRRHDNEAAECERRYSALSRLEKHELKCLIQGQLGQIAWHTTWLAHGGGDFDGQMALGVGVALKRDQRSKGFDQMHHLRKRHENRGAAAQARALRTLAYIKENGIEITSDLASKWLPLQRKGRDQGGGIAGMPLSAAFKTNGKEVTGRKPRLRGRMPHRGPAPSSGRF
jgi:relaxase-like protein